MNEPLKEDESRLEFSRDIDRLVDGELDETRRRHLLASLDRRAGGWRQLALAFVEAQTWRSDLGQIACEEFDDGFRAAEPARRSPGPLAMVLAMACSFCLAFVFAWTLRGDRPAVDDLAKTATPTEETAEEPTAPDGTFAEADIPHDERSTAAAVERPAQQVDLPVIPVRADDDPWRRVSQPVLPRLRRIFEEFGQRVEGRRELVPVQLRDGRRVVVPMEQLDVEFEKPPAYQ